MKSKTGFIRPTALIAAVAITSSTTFAALVQPFVPGNLVVDRAGDGSAALTANGTAIFLDQYTTAGALVSTVPIPTSGANQLVDSGNSTTEGFLSLNPFGTNVVLAGYNVPVGTASPNLSNAVVDPRAIATVDNNGIFTLQAISTIAHTGGNIRSAATDGNGNFWSSGSVIGSFYMGTNSATNYISTLIANERVIQVIGNNLYYSTGSGGARGIYQFSGLPTSASTPTVLINNGAAALPFAWSFNPGMNQAYVADSNTFTNSTTDGGIEKWTNNGTSWVFVYSLAPTVDGLCVDWTTTPATIYATTGNGNALLKVEDTGPGATIITNAVAPANTAFRSVVFTPTNSTFSPAVAPFFSSVTPTSQSVGTGGSATFTVNGSTGLPVASNYWFQIIGNTTNLISGQFGSLTLNSLANGNYSFFTVLSNASGSVTSGVLSLSVGPSPIINGVTPATATTYSGGQVTFSANVNTGSPVASNFWFKTVSGVSTVLTDGTTGSGSVISGSSTTNLTLSNVSKSDATNYFIVLTNTFGAVTSSVVHLVIDDTPTITSISPTGPLTPNAGNIIQLSIVTGPAGATNLWFFASGGVTNLLAVQSKGAGQTSSSFTVTNLTSASAGSYFAVLTNTTAKATSAVVSVTSVVDPFIVVEPSSVSGLAFGTMQLSAVVGGLQPFTYQWYYSDVNGNLIAPAATMADGSTVSGANTSVLTLSNWHPSDLTNFVLCATNANGFVVSTVASVFAPFQFNNPTTAALPVSGGVLALWDFDGPAYTNFLANPNCVYFPTPFIGSGTAGPVGSVFNPTPLESLASLTSTATSPFATGANDPFDIGNASGTGFVFTPYGFEQPNPNGSLGTANYPAVTGTNKANGVQFNVSTLGVKDVHIAYDSRVSSTASLYERLQYTTDGTNWNDYPESSTFGKGNFGSGNAGYYTFDYDLSGIPGVDNNANFGFRVVTEWEDTATYYQSGTTNWWVGVANAYTSGENGNAAAGTVSYDLVTVMGDAITNSDTPPVFAPLTLATTNGLAYTNMIDTNTITVNFSVSSAQVPVGDLTVTAQSLGMITGQSAGPGFPQMTVPSKVTPNLSVANTGSTNFALTISFTPSESIPDPVDGAPILITATDTHGETASTWFLLSVTSANQPPTNTLTALPETNMLANTTLTVPFFVQGANDGTTNLGIVATSDNNTVIPNANIVIGGNMATGNLTLTVTPAANQIGNGVIQVTVTDTNKTETRSTTANVAFTVRPNTNVIAVDYFNYDGGAGSSLDVVGAPYWSRFSGVFGQLALGSGVAIVNEGNTENVQAPLIGRPYRTNSGAVLYASFTVNMDPSFLPTVNGSYFLGFNSGSGNTANVEGNVVATTNGAAPGMYRLGIGNGGGVTGANSQIFPQDLTPGVNYFVMVSVSLNNGFSTLWVSPTNQASASVTDTTPLTGTNLLNISDIDLREVGGTEGVISVGNLTVGTTFNSVFYPPVANPDAFSVTENTSTLLNPLLNDTGVGLSITGVSEVDGNGMPTSNGTNVTFVPTANFVGTATFNYTITDNIGESTNSVVIVTVTAPTGPTNSANITGEFLSGTNLIVHGTNNNVPNTNFHFLVLRATNLATPLSNWTPITTNPFNSDGTFDYTNPIVPGTPWQFIDVEAVP